MSKRERVINVYGGEHGTVTRRTVPGYAWVLWDDGREFPVSEDSLDPEGPNQVYLLEDKYGHVIGVFTSKPDLLAAIPSVSHDARPVAAVVLPVGRIDPGQHLDLDEDDDWNEDGSPASGDDLVRREGLGSWDEG